MRLGRKKKNTGRRVAFSLETGRLVLVGASRTAERDVDVDVYGARDLDDLHHIPELLRELTRELDLQGCEAIGVLHPELYEMRMVEAPAVALNELPKAVRWMVRDLVDFPPEHASVDYIEIPENPARHAAPQIYVVIARNEVTELVAHAAEGAGLRLAKIDIGELALRNLASRIPEDAHGLGIVRIGRRGGRLTVTRGAKLFLSRRIEMGLERLLTPPEGAGRGIEEPALHDLGAPDTDNEDFEALLLEIQRSLDYYETQFGQAPVGDLLFAPLEEPLPELLPFMEKHLSATVRSLDLSEHATSGNSMSTADWSRALLAVGALFDPPGDES